LQLSNSLTFAFLKFRGSSLLQNLYRLHALINKGNVPL
jgi:hypothetical protein